MKLMKEDWEVREEKERKQVEEVACFVLASYAGGLRGEEVPLIYLRGMLEFWEEGRTHNTPHVILTLLGRFRGEDKDCCHCPPLADKTKSGLHIRKYLTRLLIQHPCVQERTSGW